MTDLNATFYYKVTFVDNSCTLSLHFSDVNSPTNLKLIIWPNPLKYPYMPILAKAWSLSFMPRLTNIIDLWRPRYESSCPSGLVGCSGHPKLLTGFALLALCCHPVVAYWQVKIQFEILYRLQMWKIVAFIFQLWYIHRWCGALPWKCGKEHSKNIWTHLRPRVQNQ